MYKTFQKIILEAARLLLLSVQAFALARLPPRFEHSIDALLAGVIQFERNPVLDESVSRWITQ